MDKRLLSIENDSNFPRCTRNSGLGMYQFSPTIATKEEMHGENKYVVRLTKRTGVYIHGLHPMLGAERGSKIVGGNVPLGADHGVIVGEPIDLCECDQDIPLGFEHLFNCMLKADDERERSKNNETCNATKNMSEGLVTLTSPLRDQGGVEQGLVLSVSGGRKMPSKALSCSTTQIFEAKEF
ncbi:hypothetical protein Cgig2_005879 [Carnegiea gigantea]|uniref:Uncharacterized protein n=1 Tax=Carnegiea gigantea TaxID=171969 RepID=A0A9Q1KMY8_9CARY|nr:hypothetical protein Cgig2_005879 [Carnegiea gigantea]